MDSLSCDTSVVLGSATADGAVIFAKNSDRSANECQPLTHLPRRQHRPGGVVRCQYLAIPQVDETWEVIGGRPYWLWGMEMGVNEWGVAIGNEAVHSREPYEALPALIGMDLVRLGLERGRDADESLRVITGLVERYGQGGSCEATAHRTYHNSFIIADGRSAWVLETAGRQWAAKRVVDRAAISNVYTIGVDWEAASAGVVERARFHGSVDFAAVSQDPAADLRPRVCRLERARAVLAGYTRPVTPHAMQALLRDHGGGDRPPFDVALPTICMHAQPGRWGETAGSLVAHLRADGPAELRVRAWAAFGSPCLSIFRPIYPCAVGLPAVLDRGGARYDPASPWWAHERLQRLVAAAPAIGSAVEARLRALETAFQAEADQAEAEAEGLLNAGERAAGEAVLRQLVDSTTTRAHDLVLGLTAEFAAEAARQVSERAARAWDEPNALVGIPALVPAEAPTT